MAGSSNVKKKVRGAIIAFLISNLPVILLLLFIFSGVGVAINFFSSLFYSNTVYIDVTNCSAEELYTALCNGSISDDVLESWLIDKSSMKRILSSVIDYNNRTYTGKFKIATINSYETYEPVYDVLLDEEGNPVLDEDGNITYVPRMVPTYDSEGNPVLDEDGYPVLEQLMSTLYNTSKGSDYEATIDALPENVRNNNPLQWQLVYLLCLYSRLDNNTTYTYADESGNVEITYLSQTTIDEIIEKLSPKVIYKFDPLEFYKSKKGFWGTYKLSVMDVQSAGIENYVSSHSSYNPGNIDNLVPNSAFHYIYVPEVIFDRVEASFYTDTAFIIPESLYPVWRREYSTKRLQELIDYYGNGRDLSIFCTALNELPQGSELADIITTTMDMEKNN